jgi:hypothetical protein
VSHPRDHARVGREGLRHLGEAGTSIPGRYRTWALGDPRPGLRPGAVEIRKALEKAGTSLGAQSGSEELRVEVVEEKLDASQ